MLKVFTAILGKNPEDVGALNAMGYLNLLEGNNNRAIGFYSKIDRDRYREPKIGLNVVMTLLKLNKTSNAKDVFAQVRSDGSSYYSKVQNLLARSK